MSSRYYAERNMKQPAIERETIERRDTQNTIERWALNPAVQAAAYGAVLWLGIGAGLVGSVMAIVYQSPVGLIGVFAGFPMIGYGLHGGNMLTARLASYEPMPLVSEVERLAEVKEPETPLEKTVSINIPGNGVVEFTEPQPGEFAAWVREALDDNDVTLSLNTARRRGWPSDYHRFAMNLLKDAGLVSQERNQAPIITNRGREIFSGWLRLQQVPLPQ